MSEGHEELQEQHLRLNYGNLPIVVPLLTPKSFPVVLRVLAFSFVYFVA